MGFALPAEAAYRYWSYWRKAPGATGWTYASTGPSYRVPDGTVEGWRFQDYGAGNPSDPPPRSTASFATICAGVAPADGMKRVAITVDFGARGSVASYCVRLASSATGDDALAQRAKELSRPAPRYNSAGLLCAIDGKPPAPECGKQVESPKPSPTPPRPTPSASSAAPNQPTTRAPAAPASSSPAKQPTTATRGATATTGTASAAPSRPATISTAATTSPTGTAPEAASISADPLVLETPSAGRPDDDAGLPVPTLVGVALVVALGGAAAVQMRQRT